MKLGLYKIALENLQLARNNGYPEAKLEKLTDREKTCQQKIRAGESKEGAYQRNKEAKQRMIGERLPANKKFPMYVADSLTLKKSDNYGYHIRTKQELKVGMIVATERHLAATLTEKNEYERCEYCKNRNNYNLIPCDSCTGVLYCSEKCRQEAYNSYHKYLCGVGNGLYPAESCILKLFCIGLNSFENPTKFAEFLRETQNSDATGWDVDFRGMDQKEVNKNLFLVMNSFKDAYTSRSPSDLIMLYKRFAWLTATVLNISKLKDVLVTEDHKAMLRNFIFRQSKFANQYYFILDNLVRQRPYYKKVCMGVLSITNFFNHSCAPNVRLFYDDSMAKFITLRPIKKGEQLFIGYNVEFWRQPVEVRRDTLIKKDGFICKCEACEQPHNYPLENGLINKDPRAYCHSMDSNPRLRNEFLKMSAESDVDAAVKQFRKACDYLDTHDANVPCWENCLIESFLDIALRVFTAFDDLS
jgi:hypothetical protein